MIGATNLIRCGKGVLFTGVLALILSSGQVSAQTSYVIETVAVEGDLVDGTPLPPLAADYNSGYAVMSETGEIAFAGFPDPTDRTIASLYTSSRVVAEPGDVIAGLTIDGVIVFFRGVGFAQNRLAFDAFTYDPIDVAVVREDGAGLERLVGTGDLLPDEFGTPVPALIADLGGINDLGDVGFFAALNTPENTPDIYEFDSYVRYELPDGPELIRLDADSGLYGAPRVMNNRDVIYDTGSGIDRYVFGTETVESVVLEQEVVDGKRVLDIQNLSISLGTVSQPGNTVFGSLFEGEAGIRSGIFSPTSLIVSDGDVVEGKTLQAVGFDIWAPAVNDDGVVAFGAGYQESGQWEFGCFAHDGVGLSAVAVGGSETNDGRTLIEIALGLGVTITSQGYIPFAAAFTEDGGATTSTGIFVARPITDSTWCRAVVCAPPGGSSSIAAGVRARRASRSRRPTMARTRRRSPMR
jgi:hypothetical protein